MEGSLTVFNTFVSNWQPEDWAGVYTVHAFEKDGGAKFDLVMSAGFETKNDKKVGSIKGTSTITLNDITNSKDDEIGRNETRYKGPKNVTLLYPASGAKIDF